MARKRPCHVRTPPTDCPYAAWRVHPEMRRPSNLISYGTDRYGRQRYQCKVRSCEATFLEPHHAPEGRPSFGQMMRNEALAAHLVDQEPAKVVAARLGIERQSVVRWSRSLPIPDEVPAEEGDGHEFSFERVEAAVYEQLRAIDVDFLRWVRRAGRLGDAPYVVGRIDEHRHEKATFGELRFWLRMRKVVGLPRLLTWRDVVMDPSAPSAERQDALGEMRRQLFKKNADLAHRP